MKTIIRSTLAIVSALFLSVTIYAAELAPGAVSVGKVQGEVTVKAAGSDDFVPAEVGTSLSAGAIIKTGAASSASLVFSTGSVAVISEDSTIEISKFLQQPFVGTLTPGVEPSVSDTELNVLQGEVISTVAKLRKGSSYNVVSPLGAAGVRGTKFVFRYDPKTGVGFVVVLTGRVSISVKGKAEPVDVTPGQTFNFKIENDQVIILPESNTAAEDTKKWEEQGAKEQGEANQGANPPANIPNTTFPNTDLISVSPN